MSDILGWAAGLFGGLLAGLTGPETAGYNGYAEGEFVYLSAAAAGRIADIAVAEGDVLAAGDIVFRIDDAQQVAALRAAEAEAAVAQANLDNLSTGSRSQEIDVIRAALDQARADQKLAAATLARSEQLRGSGAVSQARVDADRTSHEGATAHVKQLEAELQVAELPARDAQRIAAEASHRAALAKLDSARSALADMEVTTPRGGTVDKVYYEVGEVAGAGAPVVALLPPDSLTALFFVPEAQRQSMRIGQQMAVGCSGCPAGIRADLTRLASQPQYTPPIIYSREERARLVFRAEARLTGAAGLLPGQPLVLTPLPGGGE